MIHRYPLALPLACAALALSACGSDDTSPARSEAIGGMAGFPMPGGIMLDPGEEVAATGDSGMLASASPTTIGNADDGTAAAADGGDLIPRILATETGADPSIAQSGAALVEFFNDSLVLPRDVAVNFVDCGTANAFFAPDATTVGFPGPNIFMCHELSEAFQSFYGNDLRSAFLVTTFVFIHELGHALVDQLDLPVIGLEESYVDSVAAVLAGEGGLAEATLLTGLFFMAQDDSPWFDVHRVGLQRFGDLACYAIGSDPTLVQDPRTRGIADQLVESGRDCVAEYQQQLDGLTRILSPHIRGGLGDPVSALDGDGFPEGMNPMTDTPQPAGGGTEIALWDASTTDGNILYIGFVRNDDGEAGFFLDFRGDAFDRGDDCYIVSPHPRPIADFSVDGSGNLLLDNVLVGIPVTLSDLPDFPVCR